MGSDDEADFMPADDIPLNHKRAFGSGLHRQKVAFVPAASGILQTTEESISGTHGKAVEDLYLSIVLKSAKEGSGTSSNPGEAGPPGAVCEVCKLPLEVAAHETSLVHQVCLAHSHPPSSIDRSRMGLSVLESQGWDPDGRRGLGADGQGIAFPVKATLKDDTLGLGIVVPKDVQAKMKKEKSPQLLDAKKVRKMVQEDKKKTEKLRQQLFGRVDLDKYLGPGAAG